MSRGGYTLIEIVIAIAIFSMMLLAIVSLYMRYGTFFTRQSAEINVSQSAGATLNEINRIALQADAISASRTYSGTTYTTGSTTLVMELPSISSAGDIISNTHDYAIFYTSGTNFYRILDANASSARKSATKQLTNVLGNLTFTYDSGDVTQATKVSTDILTKSTVHGQVITTHLSGQSYLRNE